jgi:hypothetical protein
MNRTHSRETPNSEQAMSSDKYGQFHDRTPPVVKSHSDRGYSNNRVADGVVEKGVPMDRTRSERTDTPIRPADRPFPSTTANTSIEPEVELVETPLQVEIRRLRQEEQKMLLEMERIKFDHDRAHREAGRFGLLYEIAERELGLVDDTSF